MQLKKGITKALIIYQFILIILLSGDTKDLTSFLISKLILIILLLINTKIIFKYGNIEKRF